MSRLDALLSDAREVVQRNTGLLLIVASQAFFSVIGAIVKILHKVDPLMQVPLKFQYQLLPQYPDLPHELFTIRMITTYIIYMCVRSRMLLHLEFTSLNRFIVKIPDLYIGPKGALRILLMSGIGGYAISIEHSCDYNPSLYLALLGYLGYTTPFNICPSQTLPS